MTDIRHSCHFFILLQKTLSQMSPSFSAVIPAAGNSERMGSHKALLSNGHGLTFAEHLVNCLGIYGCKPVVLVVNEQFDPTLFQAENLVTVVNHHLGKGRSWSVLLGLKQVPEGCTCFIQNVDNPFLEQALLDMLLTSVKPDCYAVPVYQGQGGHPIVLGNKVVDHLRQQPDLPDFRRKLQYFSRIEVPWHDERILWNINTPGDYERFIDRNRK
jgi:CTP:molybdopterin cytidylyltransferase MocA